MYKIVLIIAMKSILFSQDKMILKGGEEIILMDRTNFIDYDDINIPALISYENIIGVQFHPEKSGKAGLNFLNPKEASAFLNRPTAQPQLKTSSGELFRK